MEEEKKCWSIGESGSDVVAENLNARCSLFKLNWLQLQIEWGGKQNEKTPKSKWNHDKIIRIVCENRAAHTLELNLWNRMPLYHTDQLIIRQINFWTRAKHTKFMLWRRVRHPVNLLNDSLHFYYFFVVVVVLVLFLFCVFIYVLRSLQIHKKNISKFKYRTRKFKRNPAYRRTKVKV